MKKLILSLIILLAFSTAGVTTMGGIALKDVKTIVTASTTSTVKLPNNYSIIEFDSTSYALQYTIVTGNAITKVVPVYSSLNVETTTSITGYTNVPKPGQILILACKSYTETITLNAAAVQPAPSNSTYTFTAAGQGIILYYSYGMKAWVEIGRTNALVTENLTVLNQLTVTTANVNEAMITSLNYVTGGNRMAMTSINATQANIGTAVIGRITTANATQLNIGTAMINSITTANATQLNVVTLSATNATVGTLQGTMAGNGQNITNLNIVSGNWGIFPDFRLSKAAVTGVPAANLTANATVSVNINGVTYNVLLRS